MSPETVSVGEGGEGHSLCRWTENRKGAGEPAVENLVRGIRRLRVSEGERSVREGVYN